MNPLSERLRLTKSDMSQTKETPENTNVCGGLTWLRGLDLNQRPSGYESEVCCVTFPQSGRTKMPDFPGRESSVEHHVVDEVWRFGQPRYMARRRFSS